MKPIMEIYQDLYGKRMLVTGAAGFIGGHLLRRLADDGLDVTGTALLPSEAQALRNEGYKADVLDLASDEPWDDKLHGIDIVFNLAAMFQETEYGEDDYDKVNHRGALKLVKTAATVGVSRFVHCSTVGVYGNIRDIPATDATPYEPKDLFQRTKLAGEQAILEFARTLPANGMTVTINRPAQVYGPGDYRLLKLFKAVLSRRFVMIGSGKCLSHNCYIEDEIDSLLLCAVVPRSQVHCEAFNIASDEPITLNELVRLIAEYGGVKQSYMRVPVWPVWLLALMCEITCKPFRLRPPLFRRRVGFFTHHQSFDLTKAQTKLGYRPRWTNREGIKETIGWYRMHGLV